MLKSLEMRVNKKLLPIKGHFFLFNAGTAPLVPYLSTYARQLGFSSATVGVIYTVLPIFGLIAKPLFGILADRFKIQKSLFILFQIVTILAFSAIYFIPSNGVTPNVELDCGDGVTVLRSCAADAKSVDKCKVGILGSDNRTARCNINCDMSTPNMWQTVCEHWHIPNYCYSATDNIQFQSHISNVSLQSDDCAYIVTDNVTLDGLAFNPHCHIGLGRNYIDINEPCALKCPDSDLSHAIGSQKVAMTCVDNEMNYRLCSSNKEQLNNLTKKTYNTNCQASCDLDTHKPWHLMEICEGWRADAAVTCRPKTALNQEFPKNLSFVGSVKLSTALSEHECVYMQMKEIQLPDGSIHYPNCVQEQLHSENAVFRASCNITCDNTVANELFISAMSSRADETSQYTKQFWLFFLCMIVSWVGQAVVVSIADAICFNLLGDKPNHYGRQRLWGSVGFGIFSFLTGILIDALSDEGAYKNYAIAFILMFVFMLGDVMCSITVKNEPTLMSMNILADVGKLVSSVPTIIFFLWTIAVGLCTGLLWNFLFWHLEDISAGSCDSLSYVKTLQGLVSAIQTFGGEIPFLFLSGYILKKLGHVNMMSLVLFALGVRFILYSFLTNPWWMLPIELFQGVTFGMFYPTMTSYANVVAPLGTETTVQGLVGAIFEGVGTSLGSFIGGVLYELYGGGNTFRWFGCGSLVFCILHMVAQYLIKDKMPQGLRQGYASVIKFEQNDTIHIMEDFTDANEESDY